MVYDSGGSLAKNWAKNWADFVLLCRMTTEMSPKTHSHIRELLGPGGATERGGNGSEHFSALLSTFLTISNIRAEKNRDNHRRDRI